MRKANEPVTILGACPQGPGVRPGYRRCMPLQGGSIPSSISIEWECLDTGATSQAERIVISTGSLPSTRCVGYPDLLMLSQLFERRMNVLHARP